MILKPYDNDQVAHVSYLLADEETRTAIVVDPQSDIDPYLEDVAQLGMHIRSVFLTHFDPDFPDGHLALRDQVGATICLGNWAQADYAFQPFADGDIHKCGSIRLQILETPGHTPESISIVIYDLELDPRRPYAIFTGDTLLMGKVGCPDPRALTSTSTEKLAGQFYDSLHQKILPLPDSTLVYPAHSTRSQPGLQPNGELGSTLGAQRRHNPLLKPMKKQAFIELTMANETAT